jgi:glyoxylate reductase
VEHANSLGIAVYNTPDVVTHSTADLTFSLLLSLIRKISQAQDFVRQDRWKGWDPELFPGEELFGKIFGILGFGKIGQAVACRALGFGLQIIYHDPFVKDIDPYLDKQVFPVDLDSLLSRSHYISIHVSLTEESAGIINRSTIAQMSRQPVIINLARGPVVDTNALVEALEKGDVRGAALDVTDPEPLPGGHPLCNLENCIVVPHIGTSTLECRNNMARRAAQNIINHFLETK